MRLVIGLLPLLFVSFVWGRVVDEKCEEYSKLFRRRRDITSFIYNFFRVSSPEKEIAQYGEFPHMAHLGFGDVSDKTFVCGGTLISDQYILTTATCTTIDVLLLHDDRKKRAVKAEHNTEPPEESEENEEEGEGEEEDDELENATNNSTIKWVQFGDDSDESNLYLVEDIIIHPNHSTPGLYNDIALIKLDRKVEFSDEVRPACLDTKDNDIINSSVIATGWGSPSYDEEFSDELMKISLTVLTEEECTKGGAVIFYLSEGMDDNQFCVGGRGTTNTLCQGDGGGPLQVKNEKYENMFDIVGLISFGYLCNVLNFPVYATRVSYFVPWIESIVWPKE